MKFRLVQGVQRLHTGRVLVTLMCGHAFECAELLLPMYEKASMENISTLCEPCSRGATAPAEEAAKAAQAAPATQPTIRALTLTQPWATLVALGAKKIEMRSWSTPYRGPLAIHAAKSIPREVIALCGADPFARVLEAAGYATATLPLGAVVAIAELADVRPTSRWVQ